MKNDNLNNFEGAGVEGVKIEMVREKTTERKKSSNIGMYVGLGLAGVVAIAVAATAIIPGVDPAVFLSTLGFYEMYVAALANLEWSILLPMVVGLAIGAVAISFGMSLLFKRWYTATFSVIFGIFLSMIPNMLTENCVLGFNGASFVSLAVLAVGFFVSYELGKRERKQ